MAQFKLKGRKALIIQYFLNIPEITIMEFKRKENENNKITEWNTKYWQEKMLYSKLPNYDG